MLLEPSTVPHIINGVEVALKDKLFQKASGKKKSCFGGVIHLSYPFRFLNVYVYLMTVLSVHAKLFQHRVEGSRYLVGHSPNKKAEELEARRGTSIRSRRKQCTWIFPGEEIWMESRKNKNALTLPLLSLSNQCFQSEFMQETQLLSNPWQDPAKFSKVPF